MVVMQLQWRDAEQLNGAQVTFTSLPSFGSFYINGRRRRCRRIPFDFLSRDCVVAVTSPPLFLKILFFIF